MKILLTGFKPFDDSPINPSEQIIESLAGESMSGVQLATAVLPVDSVEGPQTLLQAVEREQPGAIISLGQANRRTVISIERLAVNLLDFRIPDNAGNHAKDEAIVKDGPAAYFSTLPVRVIFEALRKNGIPAELSLSAGSYLCNQVLYVLLHRLQGLGLEIPAGFIHLPALPEQVAQMETAIPSMGLDTMIQGVRIAINVIAEA